MITRTQYLSGKVRRWHTHHDLQQTNADHQWGVAVILLKLHPSPSPELITAALLHDCGEYLVGDVPGYAKQNSPELKLLLDKEEATARRKIGLRVPSLGNEDLSWLMLADALEAILFVRHCARFSEIEVAEYFPALIVKARSAADALGLDIEQLTGELCDEP